jgi:hypothetical protein
MNSNIKIFLLCPIPEGQKPINQYIYLKENFLTNWILGTKKEYQKNIFFLLLVFLIFTKSIFLLTNFSPSLFLILFIGIIFFTFFLLITYFQWKDLENRFNQARIFYEEGSWYDGQIWEKPFLLIKNDKLLVLQKIQPILQRLLRLLLFFFYLLIFILFLVLFSNF